jgi:SAM-dependent methyltransferase
MDRLLELTHLAEQYHFWFRGFRQYVRPEIARAVRGVARPRLVDCGCGTGSNLAMLGEFGDAVGFDLTWNGVRFARSRGYAVARASIDTIPFPNGYFDVATSFDVFQCLPDGMERQAAREMWRVLKPGGHAILHVAALEVLSGGHAVLSQEVRRYTPSRLRRIFAEAGFAIERLTFDHLSLLPIMLPIRVWQRWRSGGRLEAGEFEITVPPAPVNALLTGLVSLEAAALRVVDMPIGSSLLLHATKVG